MKLISRQHCGFFSFEGLLNTRYKIYNQTKSHAQQHLAFVDGITTTQGRSINRCWHRYCQKRFFCLVFCQYSPLPLLAKNRNGQMFR